MTPTPVNTATWTSTPTFTAVNTPTAVFSPTPGLDLKTACLTMEVLNEAIIGTIQYRIVKLTGAPTTAKVASTSDTSGFLGIATTDSAAPANAIIGIGGTCICTFDGATTAGDYVQNSAGATGNCHDAGATWPTSGQVLGRVKSTNGAGGDYAMIVYPPEEGLLMTPTAVGATVTPVNTLTAIPSTVTPVPTLTTIPSTPTPTAVTAGDIWNANASGLLQQGKAITQSQNAASTWTFTNANAGSSASANVKIVSDAATGTIGVASAATAFVGDTLGIYSEFDAAGGILIDARAAAPIVFATNNATVLTISGNGELLSAGTAPTVSTCGTSPSTATGNAIAGQVTTGTGSPTACTLSWAATRASLGHCIANNRTSSVTPRISATSTTAITITYSAACNSCVTDYLCVQ